MAYAQMIDQFETDQSGFVRTAHGTTSHGRTLSVTDVMPATPVFARMPVQLR